MDTLAAADADAGIDGIALLQFTGDGTHGALLCAQGAADTLFGIDGIGQQGCTFLGGALFVDNMCLIFITEIPQGSQNRVGLSRGSADG